MTLAIRMPISSFRPKVWLLLWFYISLKFSSYPCFSSKKNIKPDQLKKWCQKKKLRSHKKSSSNLTKSLLLMRIRKLKSLPIWKEIPISIWKAYFKSIFWKTIKERKYRVQHKQTKKGLNNMLTKFSVVMVAKNPGHQ